MKIEKVVRVTITNEEYKALEKAEKILEEVCHTFIEDCEECPLCGLCKEGNDNRTPHNILYHSRYLLPVED